MLMAIVILAALVPLSFVAGFRMGRWSFRTWMEGEFDAAEQRRIWARRNG